MGNLSPTGHKTFDRIAAKDYIGTGNVYSNIQLSNYIRAFNDVDCNGFDWKPGDLQAADIKPWLQNRAKLGVPTDVLNFVRTNAVDRQLILYSFFHRDHGQLIVHGFAVTEDHNNSHKLLRYWTTGPTYKSYDVVKECVRAVSGGAI